MIQPELFVVLGMEHYLVFKTFLKSIMSIVKIINCYLNQVNNYMKFMDNFFNNRKIQNKIINKLTKSKNDYI